MKWTIRLWENNGSILLEPERIKERWDKVLNDTVKLHRATFIATSISKFVKTAFLFLSLWLLLLPLGSDSGGWGLGATRSQNSFSAISSSAFSLFVCALKINALVFTRTNPILTQDWFGVGKYRTNVPLSFSHLLSFLYDPILPRGSDTTPRFGGIFALS